MANFGPPTFYPSVPINEPGNGPQGVTLEAGIPVFVSPNPIPVLDASRRGAPLQVPTETIPPNVFQQED
jgi:hypothetical protein